MDRPLDGPRRREYVVEMVTLPPRSLVGTGWKRSLAAVIAGGIIALASAFAQSYPAEASVYTEEQPDGRVLFLAENGGIVPAWITVTIEDAVNVRADVDLPLSVAVPAGEDRLDLFSLSPVRSTGSRSYRYSYTVGMGDPSTAAHQDDYLYLFPYGHGEKHRVTQGHNGDFSHFGENQYALDFDLDEGAAVHAAREGLVVRVKEDSRVGGPTARYAPYGNVIMIAHDDGSFGNYVHLQYGGALVNVGDRVEAGDLIGYSGSTGLASGPHLHFDVRIPRREGGMRSIPVRFRGPAGEAVSPAEGDVFYAVHPGKPPFEVVFGSDLRLEDFAGHSAPVGESRRIEFRAEQNDLTFAVFVGNGFPYALDTTIRFALQGMTIDSPQPIRLEIPARTEVFVTLLRADPEASQWQYAPTVEYRRVE